jgi:putative DNA primase/helicase
MCHSEVPSHSESALALRFVERHGNELRYCAAWNRWYWYDGCRWQQERTHLAFDFAHAICREVAEELSAKEALGTASSKAAAGIVALARADRRIAATADQWDSDPWLLNTPAGVVDLRSGQLGAADPGGYHTKMTSVAADARSSCAQWLNFLDRIFQGDSDLVGYLQRVLGYGLTGSVSAHAMFLAYGTGANGKSVTIDTVAGILGDYHRAASIETFTAATGDRHPTELAALRGARLVTAVETEEGRRWAESRIKALTGGDMIAARFMRQDFFEFRPQFKLLIAGNHKPALRCVDEAIRRRFNLIPFAVTIPPAERDPHLSERLKAEWPGILAWMIEGCLAWQRDGLQRPKAVEDATDAYLEAEDALGAWIDQCCNCRASASDTAGALYASWKAWAEQSGEKAGSQKRFAQTLEARGYPRHRTASERKHTGIMVKKGTASHERI